jgi:hypothetical protein
MPVARCLAAAVTCCLTLRTAASAQVTTADIVGRVTDASGAGLPGVTVHGSTCACRSVRCPRT